MKNKTPKVGEIWEEQTEYDSSLLWLVLDKPVKRNNQMVVYCFPLLNPGEKTPPECEHILLKSFMNENSWCSYKRVM